MKKLIGLSLVIILLLGVAGCFKKKNDHSNEGVCIVENASVRAEASKKGQWLSSLSLGEMVEIQSAAIPDPSDPKLEYVKVKLSDGTEGYVNTWCFVAKSYVGVVYTPSKVYKRPDLLAESNQKMDIMEIIAIEEENGEFIRVTGEGRTKSGWIAKEAISKDKNDIVTAVLLKKALRGKKTVTVDEMDQIVSKLPYPDNDFVHKTREKYGLTEAAVDSEPVPDETVSTSDANDATSDSDNQDYTDEFEGD